MFFCQLYIHEAQTPPLMDSFIQKAMYVFHPNKAITNIVHYSSVAFAIADWQDYDQDQCRNDTQDNQLQLQLHLVKGATSCTACTWVPSILPEIRSNMKTQR
jgi:hypothetical protein